MVGCCVAAVLARFPGIRVELVDVDPARAAVAAVLGVGFAAPEQAAGDCDLVVHASATSAGLARSLELLADEGEVIELSWYGDRPVRAPLGEAFHSRRLTIRASQVGAVAPARRGRRSHGDRLALALRLLADPAFDALITREVAFADLPHAMPGIAGEPSALCVRVTYQEVGEGNGSCSASPSAIT
jgi:threonine dehydrogenase-like Zn-dependent dehydrogenase